MRFLSRDWWQQAFKQVERGVIERIRLERLESQRKHDAREKAKRKEEIAAHLMAYEVVVEAIAREGVYWPSKERE